MKISDLVERLNDQDSQVRQSAVVSLGCIDRDDEREIAIRALVEALKDDCREVAESASNVLSSFQQSAVPHLIKAMGDRHENTAVAEAEITLPPRALAAAALALVGIGAVAAVPALIIALQDTNWLVRRTAAIVLSFIGPEARLAVPALMKALEDSEDLCVRENAYCAIFAIDPDLYAEIDPDLHGELD